MELFGPAAKYFQNRGHSSYCQIDRMIVGGLYDAACALFRVLIEFRDWFGEIGNLVYPHNYTRILGKF